MPRILIIEDEKNLSPLDYAKDEKNMNLVNFLEKRKELIC